MSNASKIDDFLADVVSVFRKHGLALGHEDTGGAFTVEPLTESGIRWVLEADDETAPITTGNTMPEKKKQHGLTTPEVTILPGGTAFCETPPAQVGFSIASLVTKDSGLRFIGLRADSPMGMRALYEAPTPENGQPRGDLFDDFLLSLIAPPEHEHDCAEIGALASGVPVGASAKLSVVHAGESLVLGVYNPTDKPITATVKFSGPEL